MGGLPVALVQSSPSAVQQHHTTWGILTFALNAQLPIGRARDVAGCHWPLEPSQAALVHFFEGIELFVGRGFDGPHPANQDWEWLLGPLHLPTFAGDCTTGPIKTGPRGDMFYSAPIPPPAHISTAPSHSLAASGTPSATTTRLGLSTCLTRLPTPPPCLTPCRQCTSLHPLTTGYG